MLHIGSLNRAFLFMLAWLRVRADWIPPTFYPCPAQPEHLMQHARLKRLGNQFGEANPFYKSGIKPSAVNGRSHQLENPRQSIPSCSSRLTDNRSFGNRA